MSRRPRSPDYNYRDGRDCKKTCPGRRNSDESQNCRPNCPGLEKYEVSQNCKKTCPGRMKPKEIQECKPNCQGLKRIQESSHYKPIPSSTKKSVPAAMTNNSPQVIKVVCSKNKREKPTSTQTSIVRIISCGPTTQCSGPIIIKASPDQNDTNRDLRIELYIHQLSKEYEKEEANGEQNKNDSNSAQDANYIRRSSGSNRSASIHGSLPQENVAASSKETVESLFTVESARYNQLESTPPRPTRMSEDRVSDPGLKEQGRFDKSTDTDEDSINRYPSGKEMMEVGVQVSRTSIP